MRKALPKHQSRVESLQCLWFLYTHPWYIPTALAFPSSFLNPPLPRILKDLLPNTQPLLNRPPPSLHINNLPTSLPLNRRLPHLLLQPPRKTTLLHTRSHDLLITLDGPPSQPATAKDTTLLVQAVRGTVLAPLAHILDLLTAVLGRLLGDVLGVKFVDLEVLGYEGEGVGEEEVVRRQLVLVRRAGEEIGQEGEEGQRGEDGLENKVIASVSRLNLSCYAAVMLVR